MIIVLHEIMYMALAVMGATFLFRKVFMSRLGMREGVLPLVSAAMSVALAMGAKKHLGYESSELMLYMASPIAGWMWDAFFKYFFKK